MTSHETTPDRPRIRDLGIQPGVLPTGPMNAITDVAEVRVGHVTITKGDEVRTGVTAVLPHCRNLFQYKAPAAAHVGNGFGKAAGLAQVMELGEIETPIVLTNTLSVGIALDALVQWTVHQPGNEHVRSVNAVVGETNDGFLNDIRSRHVTTRHVIDAIQGARDGPVTEGAVGAGTGTVCFGFKGGIGTSSRRLPESLGGWTLGALVQSNFDGILTINGARIGEMLSQYTFKDHLENYATQQCDRSTARDDGSCMIVLATDAPLSERNLKRLAKRAVLGLARTGSFMAHGSGDFVIAFSTHHHHQTPENTSLKPQTLTCLPNHAMNPLFLSVVECVEEAVYNSLLQATTTTGRAGHTAEAIPLNALHALKTNR